MYDFITKKLNEDFKKITNKEVIITNELLKLSLDDVGNHFVYNSFIFGEDVTFNKFYITLFKYIKSYLKID